MSWQVILAPIAEAAVKYGIEYFNSSDSEKPTHATLHVKTDGKNVEELKKAIEALGGVSEVVLATDDN